MNSITIETGTEVTLEKMQLVCGRHKCRVTKIAEGVFRVTTDDPKNLFWLGMNFNHMINERV